METLYRGRDLAVSFADQPRRKPLVITFAARRPIQSLDFAGFGTAFLGKYGYPTAQITVASNHWYQTPEMDAALIALSDLASGHARIVTYGSSMGGYAAILFARLLGAEAVALSPLFSIEGAVVPWERRYRTDAAAIPAFLYGPELMRGAKARILYDPRSPDRRHVALIDAVTDAELFALPFSGHPTTTFLLETRVLSSVVRQLIDGRAPTTLDRARAVRHRSPRYWRTMAAVARRHGHLRLSVIAARRALRLDPNDGFAQRQLALAIGQAARQRTMRPAA